MRFIKSDHRYNMYYAGFRYILEFNESSQSDIRLYRQLNNAFTLLHGPSVDRIPPLPENILPRYVANNNWRSETNNRTRTRRIYFKVESDYTMAMLKAEYETNQIKSLLSTV
jgi:hypothetical protein